MPRVLIVSPNFPPVNAADMHRIRVSLPYFAEFGWTPFVLAVKPEYTEGKQDPLLLETIPQGVATRYVKALPVRLTRKVGLGDLALRALPFLYSAGLQIIKRSEIDLVYFSTTAFSAMALGRLWKSRTGVPFVLDMQDPWLSNYYEGKPKSSRPPKYWFSQRLHQVLEPWTMKRVDGLVAVSADYVATLQDRYPWLAGKPRLVLPFGASEMDFDIVRANPQPNRFFTPEKDRVHGVYVGRGGKDMQPALRIIFEALKSGLESEPDLFSRLRLHFIGTDYAPGDRARKTISPVAELFNVGEYVDESPQRIPYFEALQLLLDADFLIVPGSDDPQYTASKIYPYILARKPLVAVFHEQSSVCDVLAKMQAGTVLSFATGKPSTDYARRLLKMLSAFLRELPFSPRTDWNAFAPYSACEMTRRQCQLFDQVVRLTPSRRHDMVFKRQGAA